jgi:hypothetical protein
MSCQWVRITSKDGRVTKHCCRLNPTNCYPAVLDYARDEPDLDSNIRDATQEINRILDELNRNYAGPDRELALLAVPGDAGEDVLRLDWIYRDQVVETYLDGSY